MIVVIVSCLLLPGLMFPFQVGRWCMRHGRRGSGWAMWGLTALALGALGFAVYRNMRA